MLSRTITPTTNAQSLEALLDHDSEYHCCLLMQTPSGNVSVINYGDRNSQPLTLAADVTSEIIQINSTDSFFLFGNGTDTVSVLLTPR
jgi:hypothetical protein